MRYRRIIRSCKVVAGALAGLIVLLAVATVAGDVLIGRAYPPSGRFVDTTSGRQHVLDIPSASGVSAPTVVLLHGSNANVADMLLALGERLRPRYRVVAIDRPGNGWSERTGGEADAAPMRQAAVVREILGKLGLERVVLMGHSTGGAVAAAYAMEYPEDLVGLLLVAPAAHSWTRGAPWLIEAINAPVLRTLLAHTITLPLGYLTLDRLVAYVFAPQSAPPDYVERASIPLALRPATVEANRQDLEWIQSFIAAQAQRYTQIKTPTIIISGAADHIVPPRLNARAVAMRLPHAQLIMLRGVGHMPHYAAPERVVAAIDALATDGGVASAPGTIPPR